MKINLVKWFLRLLWPKVNPIVRDEIILSSITPGLAKSWIDRRPVHGAMLFLSESVRSVNGGKQGIHGKPYTVNPRKKEGYDFGAQL